MTAIAGVQLSTELLAALATAAVRAIALAGFAGLGLASFRVKTTSIKLFTWTAVLYAALAMLLLERVLPPLTLPTPLLFQQGTEQSAKHGIKASHPIAGPQVDSAPTAHVISGEVNPLLNKRFEWSTIRWNLVAAGIYFAVAFFLLARLFVGLAFGHRLRRAAVLIRETRITAQLASRTKAAESPSISVPVTIGVLRPIVLLPTSWREWDAGKLDAVLAHEVSHVVRRDTLTQRLSLLHCAIFWFSPLAWWLNRHLADLMEQASDEAALANGADREVYARTLLGFFEALQAKTGRVWWQGVAMATVGRAERRAEERVEKILDWKGSVAMRVRKSMAVLLVVFAVPVVYFTASANPVGRSGDPQRPQRLEIAQNEAPAPPQESSAAVSHSPKKSSSRSFHSYSDDNGQSFVIVSGGDASVTMSGMRDDAWQVEDLKKKIHGDFIWFRRDGKSYVIRDQATIDRAKAFWTPQEELGKKQEELGRQQEVLGKQQEELGARMEKIHVKVPDMTRELEKLQATLKKFNSDDATMEQIGQIQSEIGELQSKIGDLQSSAGEQQSKLGEEMGALGEKQGKLGEEQGELGRQQGELAERAERQMKQLLDESITKGTAQLERGDTI